MSIVFECFSRWWQLKCFRNFHPEPCGNDPSWRAYFSIGLKTPTCFGFQPPTNSQPWRMKLLNLKPCCDFPCGGWDFFLGGCLQSNDLEASPGCWTMRTFNLPLVLLEKDSERKGWKKKKIVHLPSGKETWQWKSIFKWCIFHCWRVCFFILHIPICS